MLSFSVPLTVWVARRIRPDLDVQCVVENASSMLHRYKQAILESLGRIPPEWALVLDAGAWAHMPRSRIFFATCPCLKGRSARRGAHSLGTAAGDRATTARPTS